jgi:hypothetical protein
MPNGGPTTPLLSHPMPPGARPSREIMKCFKKVGKEVINHNLIFDDVFRDHDREDFKRRCDKYFQEHKELHHDLPTGRKLRNFGNRLFYACLWYCDQERDMFV